jgi:hypothetical protein
MAQEDDAMERLDSLSRVLPYLRRYAQALTRSQDRGDRYVRHFIEVVLADPDLIDDDDDTLTQAFAVFHAVCRGLLPGHDAGARDPGPMSPARQLRLLASFGGFPPAVAAAIVGARRARPENLHRA